MKKYRRANAEIDRLDFHRTKGIAGFSGFVNSRQTLH
jgi:hypothetical protein